MLAKLCLASALFVSTAAHADFNFADRYTLRATFPGGPDDIGTVFYGKGAQAILGELVTFDDYALSDLACSGDECRTKRGTPAPHELCFIGDIGKVCSLLSELSKKDLAHYQDGNHAWSRLDSCRVLGRGKPVYARFEIRHDYEQRTIIAEHVIERCQSTYED